MELSGWLIDKSALARLGQSPDAADWLSRIERGLVSVSHVSLLEIGWTARSLADWDLRVQGPVTALLHRVLTPPSAEARAVEVQRQLASRGHHRGPSVADLLIAAIGEAEGLTVLHVDRDFELIAEVTGQAVERLAGTW